MKTIRAPRLSPRAHTLRSRLRVRLARALVETIGLRPPDGCEGLIWETPDGSLCWCTVTAESAAEVREQMAQSAALQGCADELLAEARREGGAVR